MNTRQQHGEPEQREGLGGRVRRFIDNELAPVLNKEDRGATDDRQRALLCARLRGRLALPHESRQLRVLHAVGLGPLPALLRLGEIGRAHV